MKGYSPIVLFTDFGVSSLYTGMMKSALYKVHPNALVIDLLSDCPAYSPAASAYLLNALIPDFPHGSVFLCVVDPGVGTHSRAPVVVHAHDRTFVGPDNGLFDVLISNDPGACISNILWRPTELSRSFHGRDLFAPIAAYLNKGRVNQDWLSISVPVSRSVERDLNQVIYTDNYGNVMTGVQFGSVSHYSTLTVCGHVLHKADVFGCVAVGAPFWYQNSLGLVEIAVNQGNAAAQLNIAVGDSVEFA